LSRLWLRGTVLSTFIVGGLTAWLLHPLFSAALADTWPDFWKNQKPQAREAIRAALSAEKSALHDAQRQAWLTEEDWRRIAARIDAERLALATER